MKTVKMKENNVILLVIVILQIIKDQIGGKLEKKTLLHKSGVVP